MKIDSRQFSGTSLLRFHLFAIPFLLVQNASMCQGPIPSLPRIPLQSLPQKEGGQLAPGGVRPDLAQPGPTRSAPGQPPSDLAEITYEEGYVQGSEIHVRGVKVVIGEYTLNGARLDGNIDKELVFTGGATLEFRGQTIQGDAIRFTPKTKSFKVENLSTALTPDFLQGKLLSPLFIKGESIYGQRKKPILGTGIEITTCDLPNAHYYVRAHQIEVLPGKRITLRRAAFVLWGHKIITLPTLVIPLDQRLHRSGYTPEFGRSVDEGFFVKSALSYLLADRAPGQFRLDLMEKKGIGTGIVQDWNLAKAAGLLALYAIPTGGTSKNLSGRLNNRINLGGGEILTLDNDFQQNSYLSLPGTTSFNNRLGFNRNVLGTTTSFNVARQSTDSEGFSTRSYTANMAQGFQFGRSVSANFNADYSQYTSGSSTGPGSTNEQLSTRLQADQQTSNYSLQLVANTNIPVGKQTQQSFFGGVEKFPELTLNNYRFTRGLLSTVPANFMLSVGRYTEGNTVAGTGAMLETERAVAGFDVAGIRYALTKSTDLNVAGGFQQYFYGDGFAQYILRNNTTLTQRFNKTSGVNLNYTYQRPEGGTPFRFDQQGQFHALNADIGFLNDRKVQLTARVGYDFGQTGFAGLPAQPWQTLSANLMLKPVSWARVQNLFSFDPNTGKMTSATGDIRLRGHKDLQIDLVSRFDPTRHKFGNINTYFDVPVAKDWRVIGLFQYNGYLNRFESRNLQIVKDLHCLEAVLTYTDNPFGFRTDRQIMFQLRIKGLPTYQRFGTGQFGQAIDTSVGQGF